MFPMFPFLEDVEPPTLSCADPVDALTDPGMPTATVIIDPPLVEDNSDPVINGSSAYQVEVPVGTYEIVFSATDAAGNAGFCSVIVTVKGMIQVRILDKLIILPITCVI